MTALACASEHDTSSRTFNPDCSLVTGVDAIKTYFDDFESLTESENWKEMISKGTAALEAARKTSRQHDEAKICAQLTSTAFYMGDHMQALMYANRCHDLSEEFLDPSLLIRALYLESAVHRALASKSSEKQAQQALYLRAVEIAEEAALIYSNRSVGNPNLKGKVYFNLGAAHADNPKGALEKAVNCYSTALECFKSVSATNDVCRTSIRLGKVYLLQKEYDLTQSIIDEVRSQIKVERIAVHVDYLEAQLKLALNDLGSAESIAWDGLNRAKALEAKEDESRLMALLEAIKEASSAGVSLKN